MKYTTFYFYFSNTLIFVQSIGIRWVSLIPAWICLWIRKEISHHYNVLLKLVKSDYNFHLYFFHFTKHDYFNSLGQLHFSICSRTQNCTWAWKSCFLYQFSTLSVFSAYMPPRLKKILKKLMCRIYYNTVWIQFKNLYGYIDVSPLLLSV